MASLQARVTARVDDVRDRRALVDHVVRTVAHYGKVNANGQAGAVTYFGFLSFFPVLALAFFAVGVVAHVYPDAHAKLAGVITDFLPGVVGDRPGEIPLATVEDNAGAAGLFGLAGVLYSGLGWLSALRNALEAVFRMPPQEQPGFLRGKARDLLMLTLIGVTLVTSVALSGALAGFSTRMLGWAGLADSVVAGVLLFLIGHGLAVAATTALFLALFRLLARPRLADRALLQGALLGALAFELLKGVANQLLGLTREQPAAQAFGVGLILLVWINYFSRITMLGASWAHTAPQVSRTRREGG